MFRSRRKFLVRGVQFPIALLIGKAAGAACTNPDEWSDGEQGTRDSLEYTDNSPDPKKTCGGCQHFNRETPAAACGNCEILSGPADAKGYCVSWTQRG
jgi:hypothetical protein